MMLMHGVHDVIAILIPNTLEQYSFVVERFPNLVEK